MSGPAILFRRAPYLVLYWIDDRLIFHNYATGTVTSGDPLVSTVLDFFGRWRSLEQLMARFAAYAPSVLRAAVTALERQSLLVRRGRTADPAGLAAWAGWNPAAGFFHLSTKDMPYRATTRRPIASLRARQSISRCRRR